MKETVLTCAQLEALKNAAFDYGYEIIMASWSEAELAPEFSKGWSLMPMLNGEEACTIADWAFGVSSKVDFHQSGTEKGTRERVRSKVTKFGYHYKFLSSF